MSEYIGEFVQESEESITELNNALLELERNPDDDAAMDDVFRTAHTLKGNCGAMGFTRASDLAHAIEDLLDAVRVGSLSITPELMDEVFAAVDDLERMIGEIDRHGDIKSDPSSRIESLRSEIEDSTGLVKPSEEETERLLGGADRLPRSDHRAFHARFSLTAPGSADAAITALSDAFDLLATDPASPEDLAEAETVDAAFGSAVDEAAVAAALDPVEAVEDAIITEVDPGVVDRAVGTTAADADESDADAEVGDPEEMEVDELLDQFEEYDDLDEAVERVDDVAGLENMGDAGAFDDIVEEEVDPAYDDAETGAETGDAAETDAGPEPAGADEEVEDAMSEFQDLQEEYDRVGLDQMEEELEGVEFGEYDQEDEVGFDELLGDDLLDEGPATADAEADPAEPEADPAEAEAEAEPAEPAEAEADPEPAEAEAEAEPVEAEADPGPAEAEADPEPADAEAEPTVSEPGEAAVEALVESARPPATLDRGVHHVRMAVPADDPDAGEAVVEALRDAFDLLGTDPAETEVVVGGHDGEIDALFGSDLPEDEVRAALHAVDGVRAAHLTDVTDRVAPEVQSGTDAAPDPADAGPAEVGVDADADADAAEEDLDPEVIQAEGEIEDAMSEFKQMQQAYDTVGLDEIEDELEDVEFGEYDEEDEVGFDELLGEEAEADPAETGAEPAEPEAEADPADAEAEPEPADPAEADADAEPEPAAPAETAPEPESADPAEADADAEPEPADLAEADADAEPESADSAETAADPAEVDAHAEPTEASADADAEPTEASADTDAVDPAAPPTDEAVAAAVEDVETTLPESRKAYHLALEVHTEPDRNNGSRVVEALRDAFDLLDTRPPEPTVAAEDPARLETVIGSHVPESEIRSALDDVEEVGVVHLTDVTDRVTAAPAAEADADAETTDAMTEFRSMQERYDTVDVGEIETELEEADLPGIDTSEEVGFEDLLEPAEIEDEPVEPVADDGVEADAGPATEGETDTPSTTADAEGGVDADTDTAEADTGVTAEDDVEVTEVEVGEIGDVEGIEDVEDPEEIDLEDIEVEGDLDDVAVSSEFGVDVDIDASSVTGEDGDAESASEPEPEPDPEPTTPASEPEPEPEPEPTTPEPEPEPSVPDAATADVQTIKGIGSAYAERLAEADVETVGDLVVADARALADETDISDNRIEEWVERAPVSPDAVQSDEPADDAEAADATRETDAIQSIRVDVDQVDELLNLVEGLVTSRARMRRALREVDVDVQPLAEELDELDVIGTEMQDVVMDMRLVPVRTVTQRLPRVVRDVARDQGKRVAFDIEGEDVEVDRSILSRMSDPLIHMVRNAVDHGIEPPEERAAAGKDEEGQVTLRAYRARDTVYVEVEDDGRGLDPDELREAAVEKGMYTEDEAERVSDDAARELVFHPGFSTNEEVTDVSGRGVGMDVVATTVEDLDGEVEVESEPGQGTTVRLALPVSVAISEVLFMEVGDEEYGVPIRVVDEIEGMGAAQPVTDGGEVVRTPSGDERELIDLGEAMDAPGRDGDRDMGGPQERGMLVTLEDDVRQAAIRCDRVRGQQEVVVKPFEGFMADIPGLSGAAILGEGDVVNILDVETL